MTHISNNAEEVRPQGTYRPEVDGLRGVAVMAVIINHFCPWAMQSGYLGVDVFFVISGLVITASLANRSERKLGSFLVQFYARRFRRLLPALIFCVLVTAVLLLLINPEAGKSLITGISALFGVSNIYLYVTSTDYFADSTRLNPFTQTWSLGVEEQFYLLFPVLVWWSGVASQKRKGERILTQLLGGISFVSLITFALLSQRDAMGAYFLMPARFWELGVGSLVYLLQKKIAPWGARTASFSSFCILIAFFLPEQHRALATPLAVFAACSLLNSARPTTFTFKVLSNSTLVALGRASYSLYLWHWSVLCISLWTIGVRWWTLPFQALAVAGLAAFSFVFVEEPLRRRKWAKSASKEVALGLLGVTSGALILLVLGKPLKGELYTGNRSLTPKTATSENRNCNAFKDPEDFASLSSKCGYESTPSQPVIYLVGDSHIFQFSAAINKVGTAMGYDVKSTWGNSCMFPAVAAGGPQYKDCLKQQSRLEKLIIERVGTNDIVFVGNALYGHLTESWPGFTQLRRVDEQPLSSAMVARRYELALKGFSQRVIAKGGRVVFYLDGPQFPKLSGPICEEQWFRPSTMIQDDCIVNQSKFLNERNRLVPWANDWADGKSRFLWDGVDKGTCDGEVCVARHFIDSNHFNSEYAELLFERFQTEHPVLFARE